MMMLAGSARSCRHPLSLQGWRCQISAVSCKHLRSASRNVTRISAAKNNAGKRRRSRNKSKDPSLVGEEASSSNGQDPASILEVNGDVTSDEIKTAGAPRSAVLQSCTLTSALLLAIGLVLREASHIASSNGWPFADPTVVSFNSETWHLELVAGLVILISSTRYILLQTWPDFRDSSEAANTQILTSLEPLDYIVVACLPGISEEFFFRGGLTEPQAREKADKEGFEVSVVKTSFKANTKALAENEGDGIAKLIYRPDTGEILGVHILGLHAADLIHEASNAIALGTSLQELKLAVHAHPTLSEVLDELFKAAKLQPNEVQERKQHHPPQPLLKVLSFITSLLSSQKLDRQP